MTEQTLTRGELAFLIGELEHALPLHAFTVANPTWRYGSGEAGLEAIRREYRLRIDMINALLPKLQEMEKAAKL